MMAVNDIFYVHSALDTKKRRSGIVEVIIPYMGFNDACCEVRAITNIINWPLMDHDKQNRIMHLNKAGEKLNVFRTQLDEIVS